MKRLKFDKTLALTLAILLIGGCFIFASAAFGTLARGATSVSSIVFSHLVLGVGGGFVLFLIALTIDYRLLRKYAPYLFMAACFFTALVFVPHIGFEHGGGRRWLSLFGFSAQPSELLKIASIIMAANYFSTFRGKLDTVHGLGGFFAILGIPAILLVLQPDLGTLGVIVASVAAIYFVAGARLRDVLAVACLIFVALAVLAFARPYVMDRITTFLDPSQGQHAESWQIKQSLIAIGSGGLFGRGFGQSVQKFTYLPEPMGDSIFAVASEELGFVGACTIIFFFLLLALRGFSVGAKTPDAFGALLAVGISAYLVTEAFINIASMLAIAPLTGIPLTFISQGGSAMLVSLASAGLLLNVSRHQRRSS